MVHLEKRQKTKKSTLFRPGHTSLLIFSTQVSINMGRQQCITVSVRLDPNWLQDIYMLIRLHITVLRIIVTFPQKRNSTM